MKSLKTKSEAVASERISRIFANSADPLEARLENFPKYARRKTVTRYLALYEVFKRVLEVKGSIIECGVRSGFGLMSWAQFSAVLEPANLMRRIYGFDTFAGFPDISKKDRNPLLNPKKGGLKADSFSELASLIEVYDSDRFLGHVEKIRLVKGDAIETIPKFVQDNQHLVVSLLFMDFDLYEPTKAALEAFVPRMPKGAVLAFDELDNPIWPGETSAALESVGLRSLKIQRLPWDPYIGFAVLD
ncbi:MAG: dTDP-6-deoxy-L-hexose 3-O-methyltransferase [Elusimicrobia bacterium CG_4_9_14_3_um_filter_62_55]|nr:MAG: dTDP-6-deoxy-L-hexose 3-O-methyltransferase [Elusimicrobia bacterium CG22_combo_CG10-13_8_21_14_all_63_91]PJB24385.1 MAG: dTDP-6-deoxy-L-hexose 3-O-methyltransferase [Elusimicrobia bacterium CG_4_9_14_3_um_filter_62_55]